jgi:hypothetical protein
VKSNERLLSEWADAIQGNVSLDHVIVCGNQLARALRGFLMTKEEEEAIRIAQSETYGDKGVVAEARKQRDALRAERDTLHDHVKWLETERHWLIRLERLMRDLDSGAMTSEECEPRVSSLLVDLDIVRARKP